MRERTVHDADQRACLDLLANGEVRQAGDAEAAFGHVEERLDRARRRGGRQIGRGCAFAAGQRQSLACPYSDNGDANNDA